MIRAVIFDIDGTLLDSVDLHAQAWKETLKHFGKEIPFEDVRHQIGKGGDQLLPVFFSQEELDRLEEEVLDYRSRLFKRDFLPKVRPFPKVRELFSRLVNDGLRIALASSASEEELTAYKAIARIDDLVDEDTSADDANKSKPHPDIFEAAFKGLKDIARDQAKVVGDTPYDAQGAGKAGLHRIVGVLCGGFSESELLAAGCSQIFCDPADLLARYAEFLDPNI